MNYKFKPSHIVPAYLFIVAVLYGGSKPPASTNTPPDFISGDSTNSVPDDASSPTNHPPPVLMASRPRLVLSAPPQPTTNNQQLTTNMPWHVRGAYCDWLHITFPDGFAFPSGTNLLTGVTVMAYGTLRQTLKDPTPITALPQEVSLEPSASSFVYGLTSSNSFVFSWQNVCVNRSPTNRVDASIELFRSGAIATTVTPLSTNQPPITIYQPPIPPEGFVGQGQDDTWLAAAFSPADYAVITNKGYARWIDEDYVGYNEENGHYKASVTVHSMPPDNEPCYLVCGPYKVIVKEPGTYDFPLEVFNEYPVRTYPTAVPLSISYDEGYYPDDDDYGPLMSPLSQSAPLLLGSPSPTPLTACMIPALHLSPSYIDFSSMVTRHVRIWCNMAHAAWDYVTLGPAEASVRFHNRHDAEVLDWMSTQLAVIEIYESGHPEVFSYLHLIPHSDPNIWEPDPPPTNSNNDASSTNTTSTGTQP